MRHIYHEEDNKRCLVHKVGLRINTARWKFMVTVERRAADMFIRCGGWGGGGWNGRMASRLRGVSAERRFIKTSGSFGGKAAVSPL